jgi:putative sigma-54 modulation protein
MKIEIKTRGFSVTPGLRSSIERRLEFALDRYEDRIAWVRVTVGDVNGPKGGEDKSCRVEIQLRNGRRVAATALRGDAYAAIGAAAHAAGRGVARTLRRERVSTRSLFSLARALSSGPSRA